MGGPLTAELATAMGLCVGLPRCVQVLAMRDRTVLELDGRIVL